MKNFEATDAHTHFFPTEYLTPSPIEWAAARGESYWVKLVGSRPDGKRSLQGFPSVEKFIADMDGAGIRRAIIQNWYWERPETCAEFDKALMKAVAPFKDRLSAFAAIQPAHLEFSLSVIERARENGFCGVGELHDGVQKFSYASAEFEKIARKCAECGLPISLHITENTERNYTGKVSTQTSDAFATAKKFPQTKFIFAHWGGGKIFEYDFDASEYPNVYYDSAATSLLYPESVWEKAARIAPENIIYGSDYPLRLYPKKFREEEMLTFAEEARGNIPQHAAEKFFFRNAEKIFG